MVFEIAAVRSPKISEGAEVAAAPSLSRSIASKRRRRSMTMPRLAIAAAGTARTSSSKPRKIPLPR
jgi:hypothetical protein